MKTFIRVAFLASSLVASANALFEPPEAISDSQELRTVYPALNATNRPGNPLILCPFLRMVERSGRLDDALDGDYTIANEDLKQATTEFGCDTPTACGPVIDLVSSGQRNGGGVMTYLSLLNPFGGGSSHTVDLERLWDAPPVSHGCGFTFAQGLAHQGVSEFRLRTTMAKFSSRKDANGHLVYQDILEAKEQICLDEGVEMTSAGETEAQLIYAYLGGIERGFVEYSDVERFLQVDNEMPLTKAAKQITFFYLGQISE